MNDVNVYCIMTLHFFSYKPCNLIRGITMRYISIVLAALLPLAGCSSTAPTVNAAPKADKVEVAAPAAATPAPMEAAPAPAAAPDAPAYTEDKPAAKAKKSKKKSKGKGKGKGKTKLKGKKSKKAHAKHGKKVKKAAKKDAAAK
ncbi:MAG: hypothetical protein RIS84_1699 [Pseudomonadota bacterium]|jgi:hypothetical protein